MRILIYNSKGGCGKSLLAREVIAAPNAEETVIVEIDELNLTQLAYEKYFKEIIELKKGNIKDLLMLLNKHENIIIDVGVDNLSDTLKVLVDYQLFDDIDLVVIPLTNGRTDGENALKTYSTISKFTKKIMFAFSRYDDSKSMEYQYQVFFNNIGKVGIENINEKYITINESDIFTDAQNTK